MKLLNEIKQGQNIYLIQKLPDWVIKYLGLHFQHKLKQEITIKDMRNVDEVKKAYKRLRYKS